MNFRFLKYFLLLAIMGINPLHAQIRIESLRANFKNIPIVDSVINFGHYQEGASSRDYKYYSNDSGYTIISGDTVYRFDKITQSYIEPDGTLVPEQYEQEIFFVLDTFVNRIRHFSLNYGFSDANRGWYSNEIIRLDSINILRNSNYYHSFISGRELAQNGFYLHAERGNILPNIPGWLTRMRQCDSNDCGSVEIFLNGSIPLTVVHKKSVDKFIVIPNPAQDFITISSKLFIENIEIYDLLGRKFLSETADNYDGNIRFNVSTLLPGIYSLRVNNQSQKFIIKR